MQKEHRYNKRRLARTLRKQPTVAELHLWEHLRGRQVAGFRFRRQANIGRYIADFVCFEAKVVVELDGSVHLGQQEYDQIRDEWFICQGFKVLRFWNDQVMSETEQVIHEINQVLNACSL